MLLLERVTGVGQAALYIANLAKAIRNKSCMMVIDGHIRQSMFLCASAPLR